MADAAGVACSGLGALDVFTGVCEQQLGDGSILTLHSWSRCSLLLRSSLPAGDCFKVVKGKHAAPWRSFFAVA